MPAPNLEPPLSRPPLFAKIAALLVSGSVASLALLQGFGAGCQAVEGSTRGDAGSAPVAAPPVTDPPVAADPPAADPPSASADAPAGGSTGAETGGLILIGSPTSSGARYIGGSKSNVDIWGLGPDETPETIEPGAAPAVKRKPSRMPRAKKGPEEGAR